jgi:hypothetical protein
MKKVGVSIPTCWNCSQFQHFQPDLEQRILSRPCMKKINQTLIETCVRVCLCDVWTCGKIESDPARKILSGLCMKNFNRPLPGSRVPINQTLPEKFQPDFD